MKECDAFGGIHTMLEQHSTSDIANHLPLWVKNLILCDLLVAVPMGGGRVPFRGREPLMRALFGENVCKNEKIGS